MNTSDTEVVATGDADENVARAWAFGGVEGVEAGIVDNGLWARSVSRSSLKMAAPAFSGGGVAGGDGK